MANQPGKAPAAGLPSESSPMDFPYVCLANQPGKAPAASLPPESSPMDFPFACLANQPGKAPAERLPPESSPMDFPVLYGQVTPSCSIILLQFHPAIVYFSVPLHDTADSALLNLAGM